MRGIVIALALEAVVAWSGILLWNTENLWMVAVSASGLLLSLGCIYWLTRRDPRLPRNAAEERIMKLGQPVDNGW